MLQVSASRDLDLIVASTAANQVYLFNLRDGRFVQVIDLAQYVEKPVTEDKKLPKPNYRITHMVTTWTGYVLISVTSLHSNLPNYLFCFDVNGYLLYNEQMSGAFTRCVHPRTQNGCSVHLPIICAFLHFLICV